MIDAVGEQFEREPPPQQVKRMQAGGGVGAAAYGDQDPRTLWERCLFQGTRDLRRERRRRHSWLRVSTTTVST